MPTELVTDVDGQAFYVGIRNRDNEYMLWQSDKGQSDAVYFEYNDQINSGYGITKSVAIDDTGCVVVLVSGASVVIDWEWPLTGDIDGFLSFLRDVFESEDVDVVDAQGFYRR